MKATDILTYEDVRLYMTEKGFTLKSAYITSLRKWWLISKGKRTYKRGDLCGYCLVYVKPCPDCLVRDLCKITKKYSSKVILEKLIKWHKEKRAKESK